MEHTGRGRDVVIPDVVTGINMRAFHDCSSLTSVTIHSSVTVIKENAFEGCDNLQKFSSICPLNKNVFGKTIPKGMVDETDIIDYFWLDATVTDSPKQLGSAKNAQERIDLLKNGVYDGWVSDGDKLFENKSIGGYKRKHNPTHFITMIQEYVQSIRLSAQMVQLTGNNC